MAEKSVMRWRLIASGGMSVTAWAVALPLSLSLLTPAVAQFFPFFGPYQPPVEQPRPQVDYSRAPAPKKAETPPTTTIVVMGDSMADWLAYGLEDAFSDTPEIGIIRKHRAYSGLIRYEARSDLDWPRVARDILAVEKPGAVVMLLGLSDRQAIRERPPAKGAVSPQGPEQPAPDAESPDLQITVPEPQRGSSGTAAFRSERWNELYAKRIDDMIAALKSKGVPVIWVGLPVVRGPKATSDTAYLNDLYRAQAEKAGIIYVDVWDGFVDEAGKFASYGPDVDGQTRRLRTPDGVYFTKFGARKLAHYVEREIHRVLSTRILPVALPSDESIQVPSGISRPGVPAPRPAVGAIVPLTATAVPPSEELLGAGGARPAPSDPIAARVLVKGEPVAPLKGRADNFVWPPEDPAAAAQSTTALPAQAPAAATAQDSDAGKNAATPSKQTAEADKPVTENEHSQSPAGQTAQKKPQSPTPTARDNVPRPPAPIGSSSAASGFVPFGWFR